MSDPESATTMRRLGIIAVILGFLASCDSAHEITQTGLDRPAAGFEFALALTTIVCGLGLLQRRRWALPVAVVAAAAAFLHSVVVLAVVGPTLLRLVTILEGGGNGQLCLRLMRTATEALFWPILLGLLYIDLQCRPPEDPATRSDKRTFRTCAAAALVFAMMVETVFWALANGR